MEEKYTEKHPDDFDGEIDLRELFNVLWEAKWIIFSVTAFISIIGVIYSLLLPNIYESKALLVPAKTSESISGSLGRVGNLAGLARINLPTGIDYGNAGKATHKIKSLSFFEDNILPNIYLPDLMAVKSWDRKTNKIIYDDNIYDTNTNTWLTDYSYPKQKKPSAQKSFIAFKSKLNLDEDTMTSFITVSIQHQSPFIAKEWTELIVNEINSFYRKKDKLQSERAISYLNQQISMTDLSEIKQVLAEILQEETKRLTLVEANKFYVFDYIDPPSVMEQKSAPSRALICILSAFLGGMLSVLIVLIRYFIKKTS